MSILSTSLIARVFLHWVFLQISRAHMNEERNVVLWWPDGLAIVCPEALQLLRMISRTILHGIVLYSVQQM